MFQVLTEDSKMEGEKEGKLNSGRVQKVGQSQFYETLSTDTSEKQDTMKTEDYSEEEGRYSDTFIMTIFFILLILV